MATFSERLKSLRSEKGWSQQRLADELKLSKSSINMYERGEREPGFETMEAIADTFNVDMDYLYGRTDVKIAEPIQFNADAVPSGFRPLPEMVQVPLIGNIACGTPHHRRGEHQAVYRHPGGLAGRLCPGMPRGQHGPPNL